MSSLRPLAAALIGSALLITGTGCQASSPQTQGSTVKPRIAQMPTLPEDPNAAEAAVRAMLMKEATALLKASGLKYTRAQFGVPTSFNEDKAQNGELAIEFEPCSDQQVQAMTAAIWANGWAQGGVSHGVNVHKGPLYLQWGKGYSGCHFAMTTVNIRQYLPGIADVTRVPELVPYKAAG